MICYCKRELALEIASKLPFWKETRHAGSSTVVTLDKKDIKKYHKCLCGWSLQLIDNLPRWSYITNDIYCFIFATDKRYKRESIIIDKINNCFRLKVNIPSHFVSTEHPEYVFDYDCSKQLLRQKKRIEEKLLVLK